MTAGMSIWDATAAAFLLLVSGDPDLWVIVWVSLKTTLIALSLCAIPAMVLAYVVARSRFPGRRLAIVLIQASLAVPTVLIGLLLYLLLSRQGPLGQLGWLFTQQGMILGQAILGAPIIVAFVLAAVQGADPRLFETAAALGAGPLRQFWTVLRELRFAVLVAVATGFGRIISEVGLALMIGGNIAGVTRTMTTAIALETSKGEFAQGIALGLVLLVLAIGLNALVSFWQGRHVGAP